MIRSGVALGSIIAGGVALSCSSKDPLLRLGQELLRLRGRLAPAPP